MVDSVQEFLSQPLVAPLYILIVLTVLNFVLKVFASTKEGWPGQFQWAELPRILRTAVVDKVFPLALLGVASYLAPKVSVAGVEVDVSTMLQATYLGGCAIAILAELATIREAFPGPDGGQTPPSG